MRSSVDRLFGWFVHDETVSLQVRLYRLCCATTFVLCLAVILPFNALQNLPVWVHVGDIAAGLLGGYCYWQSRRGRNYLLGFYVLLLLLMSPVWFFNAGSEGSVGFYYFPLMLYPAAVLQGWTRRIMTAVVILNFCALLALEYWVPSLNVPFHNAADRMLDLATGAVCGLFGVALVARLITATYDREKQRLSDYAARLASSEQNYREIFNATSDALVIQDAAGRIVDVNERMCLMFGCDRAGALSRSVADLSLGQSPYSAVEAAANVERTLAEGPRVFVWRCRRASGELFWAEVALRAGVIAGEKRVIASIRDITARVESEQALRTNEERLRLALEASKQGWFDIDVQTGEGRASGEYARIVGLPAEDFRVTVGDWLAAVHPDDQAALRTAFEECVTTGRSRTMEYRRQVRNGAWKWIRSAGKIVEFDATGKALRMMGTHTDVTERKELEARLLHSQRMEAVATLAGGVAHDLNNILTPMLVVGSVLREKLTDPADHEMMTSLEVGARRGAAIVRQLQDFSHSLAHQRVRLDPARIIHDAAEWVRATFPSEFAVVERVSADLWQVTADPLQLQQVMENLCTNARQAMPQGGTLTLTAENTQRTQRARTTNPWGKAGPFVQITVADTGRGIPPDIIGRIFDPFFTTRKIGEGTGLGLSTVHGIVNGLGGVVEVESVPGHGATFRLFLPAAVKPPGGSTPPH